MPQSSQFADLEATLDQPIDPSASRFLHRPKVGLVEGTIPRLSSETRALLRNRLAAAVLLAVVGISIFLLRQVLFEPGGVSNWVLGAADALAIALCGLLVGQRPLTLGQLRVIEVAFFLALAGMLALLQHLSMTSNIAMGEATWTLFNFMTFVVFTYGVVFEYAMFIPTRWHRAAVMICLIAAGPLVTLGLDVLLYPEIRTIVGPSIVVLVALMLGFGAFSATYGAYTIGNLRSEAYAARQLGQYRLTRLVGSGGMGEVYLGEHVLLKRPCAIKVIRPAMAGDPKVLARFEREVRATAKLTHWNTVQVFDYGRAEDGTFYYVMEFLRGMNLAEMVERHGPLPPPRAVYLLRQICQALAEAHEQGLVHRDLKPANVFVAILGGRHDVAKLLDFGLVRPAPRAPSVRLTRTGSVTGSPLFMAPEQALGNDDPDRRADLYALGAVAYFAVTGQPPFVADNPLDVLVRHARDPVIPPSAHVARVPADLERVVLRCLEKKPEDRYPDVIALERELAACANAAGWSERDAAEWWRRIGQTAESSDRSRPALASA